MILPDPKDIGREVIYARRDPHRSTEFGVITSFNERYVFVRYGAEKQAKATKRRDLEWANQVAEIAAKAAREV